jgi:hypothetical protein
MLGPVGASAVARFGGNPSQQHVQLHLDLADARQLRLKLFDQLGHLRRQRSDLVGMVRASLARRPSGSNGSRGSNQTRGAGLPAQRTVGRRRSFPRPCP